MMKTFSLNLFPVIAQLPRMQSDGRRRWRETEWVWMQLWRKQEDRLRVVIVWN